MSSRIDSADRELLRRIFDVLLPATAEMPAASRIGVADNVLDHLLHLRPELVPDLLRGIRLAREIDPTVAVTRLAETDAAAFKVLRTLALAGYYLDPEVRKRIGYPGQQNLPPDLEDPPAYVANGMLDAVKARGPIWKQAQQQSSAIKDQSTKRSVTMAKHTLVVFSNPMPGREDDYNEWQDNVHVPQVLSIPGFVSAQRYCLSGPQFLPSETRPPYITLYQIETDDLAAVYAEAGKRMASLTFSDALQMETFATHSYTAVGKTHVAK